MRKPTDVEHLFTWHRAALAGEEPPIHGDEPQCGWFRRRLVPGGTWVRVRVYLRSVIDEETGELCADETLCCERNGRACDPVEEWPWICDKPITFEEYRYLGADRDWAVEHAPHYPAANPHQPIDWLTVPLPTFTPKGKTK